MKDFGFLVKVQTYINAKNIDVKWALADIDDAVEKMQFVVENKNIALEKAENGYKWAKENFDWDDVIFPKMLSIVEEKFKDFERPKILLKQII